MLNDIADRYLFDRPGHYQIRIVGKIDAHWLDCLESLQISTSPWGNYQIVTQISGWLADQTALSGLLNLLNDLGRVILTVERLEDEQIE